MFKRILAVAALLFAGLTALAGEITIPEDKRVKNLPSGCCAWASVENLGNVHGVPALKGLTQKRHARSEELVEVEVAEWMQPYGWVVVKRTYKRGDAGATPASMKEQLDALKIRYKLQDDKTRDTAILKEAVAADLGCAVGLRDWPRNGDYHMVTLTDLTDKKCVFVENRGKCERYEGTREWFDLHFSGFAVIIYPPAPPAPMPREKK